MGYAHTRLLKEENSSKQKKPLGKSGLLWRATSIRNTRKPRERGKLADRGGTKKNKGDTPVIHDSIKGCHLGRRLSALAIISEEQPRCTIRKGVMIVKRGAQNERKKLGRGGKRNTYGSWGKKRKKKT